MARPLVLAILLVAAPVATGRADGDRQFDSADGADRSVPTSSARILTMLPGIVRPSQQVDVSAPLEGVITELRVEEGDSVDVGAILAVSDHRIALADVQLAEVVSQRTAAIQRAQNERRLAKDLLERLLAVEDPRAVSEIEVERARSSYELAEAALIAAREDAAEAAANLQVAKARLEAHNIRAPFDGQVLKIESTVGQMLEGSDVLLRLANLKTLKTELYVPVAWYGRLQVGDTYSLAAANPVNQTIPAKLISFEPIIDAATQSFRCVFELDNSNLRLPSGFTVRMVQPVTASKLTRTHPPQKLSSRK